MDFSIPYEKLLRDKEAVLTLAKLFNSFSIQKEKITSIYQSSDLFKQSSLTSKAISTTNLSTEINQFKKLINSMLRIRTKFGLKLTPNFVDELVSSLSFDYEKLVFDPNFRYCSRIYVEHGILFNIFLSRGFVRNYLLECIYFQDLEFSMMPLDVADQKFNKNGSNI